MAEPITWRNIGGPNFGGVAQQGNTGVQTLNQGFNALGGTVSKLQEAAILQAKKDRELNTAKLIQEQQNAKTVDEFNAIKGKMDVGLLQQQYGADGVDFAALVSAQPKIEQSILQRQQLGNELQKEALAAEAAPVIATMANKFAVAKNDAELGAVMSEFSNHPNSAVRAKAAELFNTGQKEVLDFKGADLTNQSRQLEINNFKEEERIRKETSAYTADAFARFKRGDAGAGDVQKELLSKVPRNEEEAKLLKDMADNVGRYDVIQKDFGKLGVVKEDLINKRVNEATTLFTRAVTPILEARTKELERTNYLEGAALISPGTDHGSVVRKLIVEREKGDPAEGVFGLDVDHAVNNVMGAINIWKQKYPQVAREMPENAMNALLSNIVSSEDSWAVDIANMGTIADKINQMVPDVKADQQERELIKADIARLKSKELTYNTKIQNIISQRTGAIAEWQASPAGIAASESQKNDYISKITDEYIDRLAEAAGEKSIKTALYEKSLAKTRDDTAKTNKAAADAATLKGYKTSTENAEKALYETAKKYASDIPRHAAIVDKDMKSAYSANKALLEYEGKEVPSYETYKKQQLEEVKLNRKAELGSDINELENKIKTMRKGAENSKGGFSYERAAAEDKLRALRRQLDKQ